MTQTVPDISPLMPMHQDPLLVFHVSTFKLEQHVYIYKIWITCTHTRRYMSSKTLCVMDRWCNSVMSLASASMHGHLVVPRCLSATLSYNNVSPAQNITSADIYWTTRNERWCSTYCTYMCSTQCWPCCRSRLGYPEVKSRLLGAGAEQDNLIRFNKF